METVLVLGASQFLDFKFEFEHGIGLANPRDCPSWAARAGHFSEQHLQRSAAGHFTTGGIAITVRFKPPG